MKKFLIVFAVLTLVGFIFSLEVNALDCQTGHESCQIIGDSDCGGSECLDTQSVTLCWEEFDQMDFQILHPTGMLDTRSISYIVEVNGDFGRNTSSRKTTSETFASFSGLTDNTVYDWSVNVSYKYLEVGLPSLGSVCMSNYSESYESRKIPCYDGCLSRNLWCQAGFRFFVNSSCDTYSGDCGVWSRWCRCSARPLSSGVIKLQGNYYFKTPDDNEPPICDAGEDKEVNENESIQLDASSSDPDEDFLTYNWLCSSIPGAGVPGFFNDSSLLSPIFTAGEVFADTDITCTLTVTDDDEATCSDSMIIHIINDVAFCGDGICDFFTETEENCCTDCGVPNSFCDDDNIYHYYTCDGNLIDNSECNEEVCGGCDEDLDCPCLIDSCVDADVDGYNDDWADYPDFGTCSDSCICGDGTEEGQPCEPVIDYNNSSCATCGDGTCNEDEGETKENCCSDCGIYPQGCDSVNLRYWYECIDNNLNRLTENCEDGEDWENVGSPYDCCEENISCTCQDQEWWDYNCSDLQMFEYYNTNDNSFENLRPSDWRAQTFTPSITHKITSLKLKLYRANYYSPGIGTFSIKATDANGYPTGPDLCLGTINFNSMPTDEAGLWYEISLGDGYTVSAGSKYAIVGRSAAPYGRWKVDHSSAAYSGGACLRSGDGGNTWTLYDGPLWFRKWDLMFEEWGTIASLGECAKVSVEETKTIPSSCSCQEDSCEAECSDGQTENCGIGDTGTKICQADCTWGDCEGEGCPDCTIEGECRDSIKKACEANAVQARSYLSDLKANNPSSKTWCTYNEHDGCEYVKSGIELVNGQLNPDFWEGDLSCDNGVSSSLYGEKRVSIDDPTKYEIKAKVYIDDNSWVWINGELVEGLIKGCCGWTDWVDVTSYFHPGWNTVKFRAEDTCSGERYFDLEWNVNQPPIANIYCDPEDCCYAYTNSGDPVLTLLNESTDGDGIEDIVRSEWSGIEPTLNCSNICDYTVQTATVGSGFYDIYLKVIDNAGASDTAMQTIEIKNDIIADFECSMNEDGPWETCEGFRAIQKELIYLKDISIFSDGANKFTSRIWKLNGVIFSDENEAFPSIELFDRWNTVELRIEDSEERIDTATFGFRAELPLPTWQEVAP